MMNNALSPLALALSAAASSRFHLEDREPELRSAFIPAIAEMDTADAAYRRAIEETLSKEAATHLLSAMASFRDRVRDLREGTRREIGEIYRRYGMSYGAFDPLDPYVPPTNGFTHADSTRVATIADRARSMVDELRAQGNAAALQRLSQEQIEQLIAAKRARREAFEASLRCVLENVAGEHSGVTALQRDKALYELTQLADGWY
jgi:hypothetical protein